MNIENYRFLCPLAIIASSSYYFFATCVKNGKGYYHNPLRSIIYTVINAFLLYGAGFFNQIGWPQIVWLIMTAGGLTIVFKDKKEQKYNVAARFFANCIVYFVYYMGGAFQYLSNKT